MFDLLKIVPLQLALLDVIFICFVLAAIQNPLEDLRAIGAW
jgi:hypothetical protein